MEALRGVDVPLARLKTAHRPGAASLFSEQASLATTRRKDRPEASPRSEVSPEDHLLAPANVPACALEGALKLLEGPLRWDLIRDRVMLEGTFHSSSAISTG